MNTVIVDIDHICFDPTDNDFFQSEMWKEKILIDRD